MTHTIARFIIATAVALLAILILRGLDASEFLTGWMGCASYYFTRETYDDIVANRIKV